MSLPFLSIENGKIVANSKPVKLRGVNFGGWLMMEGYILGGRNIPEKTFHKKLCKHVGAEKADKFKWDFRDSFIIEEDLKNVKKMGCNVVRVPVHYRLFQEQRGWDYFDKVVKLFTKNNLYFIIDMHSVPGCQNPDWHCDSEGQVLLYDNEKYQKQLCAIWKKIAKKYRECSTIAAYDIMNEPVTDKVKELNIVYHKLVETVRSQNDEHIIMIEGNAWASDFECLDEFEEKNIMYSAHFYRPIEVTFNLVPNLVYPGMIGGKKWDKTQLRKEIKMLYDFANKRNAPMLIGEFGITIKCGCCKNELQWVVDVVDIFEEFDFHWTYWTYKAVGDTYLPNGIYQLFDQLLWTNKVHSVFGWELFPYILTDKKLKKNTLFTKLKTSNFDQNKDLVNILTKITKNKS